MSANLFIIPHDFSTVADKALEYAIKLGEKRNTELHIIHVTDDEKEAKIAQAKLEEITHCDLVKNCNLKVSAKIAAGNIFEDIGKYAEEVDARMIIMGTHGAKGMQKLFGSHAIKVINSCRVPFMVVQEDISVKPIKKIVCPIDLAKESLQIINYAADLALMFDAEVHIVGEKQSDARLAQQIKIRIALVKKEYEEHDVKNEINLSDGSKPFHKKVLNYGKEQNADMFALAYHSDSLLPQFDRFAQTLITNNLKLPCLIIDSEEVSNSYY